MKASDKKTKSKVPEALPQQPLSTPVTTASGLDELFTDGLKEIYWAERHLVKSLPKMMNSASEASLQSAIENHLAQTKEHADNLETILERLGLKLEAKKCDAMEGLVMAGEHVIENTVAGSEARNLGITLSALKVESFEIASYNGLIQLATTLGYTEAADLLNQNLTDEMEAKEQLTTLSQQPVSEVK